MHTLRSVPYPMMLIAFAAIAFTEAPKRLLAAAAVLALLQSAWFFVHFVRDGQRRMTAFQAGCKPATEVALAQRKHPIYLIGHLCSINSIWYGAPRGVSADHFVVYDPAGVAPPGSVVVTDYIPPAGARSLFAGGGFRTYIAP